MEVKTMSDKFDGKHNKTGRNHSNEEEFEVTTENEINEEALDVIFRLYDKTFKDLVDR